jgi:pyruvate kinase
LHAYQELFPKKVQEDHLIYIITGEVSQRNNTSLKRRQVEESTSPDVHCIHKYKYQTAISNFKDIIQRRRKEGWRWGGICGVLRTKEFLN